MEALVCRYSCVLLWPRLLEVQGISQVAMLQAQNRPAGGLEEHEEQQLRE